MYADDFTTMTDDELLAYCRELDEDICNILEQNAVSEAGALRGQFTASCHTDVAYALLISEALLGMEDIERREASAVDFFSAPTLAAIEGEKKLDFSVLDSSEPEALPGAEIIDLAAFRRARRPESP